MSVLFLVAWRLYNTLSLRSLWFTYHECPVPHGGCTTHTVPGGVPGSLITGVLFFVGAVQSSESPKKSSINLPWLLYYWFLLYNALVPRKVPGPLILSVLFLVAALQRPLSPKSPWFPPHSQSPRPKKAIRSRPSDNRLGACGGGGRDQGEANG